MLLLSNMIDNYRHRGLRKKLVNLLRDKGVKDERILSAFHHIPRHLFLDSAFAELAYKDQAFPIACDQTISQPYTVAMQTQLLGVQPGDIILEIGTGSGFQSAVLHYLGARVYSIERHLALHSSATNLLERIGFGGVRTFHGDGTKGLPSRAPFDKILVTAGAIGVPQALKQQLKVGGVLVIPVGEDEQVMKRITRVNDTVYRTEEHGAYKFVPLLSGKTREAY